MYRTSNDLRFVKNREALRRAYIDLVKQWGTDSFTVRELTERARVNRMTFYSHYDTIGDILAEYVDDMTRAIMGAHSEQAEGGMAALFQTATELMQQEIEFFRLVAKSDGFERFRSSFRAAFRRIFEEELKRAADLKGTQLALATDMVASGVTYAYLDWLAGDFSELPLDDMLAFFEKTVGQIAAK